MKVASGETVTPATVTSPETPAAQRYGVRVTGQPAGSPSAAHTVPPAAARASPTTSPTIRALPMSPSLLQGLELTAAAARCCSARRGPLALQDRLRAGPVEGS